MQSPEQLILKYGGKAASLVAQHQAGNTDFLFPFTLVNVADWEKGIGLPYFDFKYLQIVRGSAIGDEKGLVDVITTLRNKSSEDLNNVIKQGRPLIYSNPRKVELALAGNTLSHNEFGDKYSLIL